MIRFLLPFLLLFCGAPAEAQFNGCPPGICNATLANFPMAGIAPNGVDCYFSQALYYPSQSACAVTAVRASGATNLLPTSTAGFSYTTYANNVGRLVVGSGYLVEEARTNFLLNSTAPATQTTGILVLGTYTLWVNGAGSATISSGTGTGCGTGVATQGNQVSFVIAIAGTCTVTVSGALNAFQLELNPGAVALGTSLIVTDGATAARAAEALSLTTFLTLGSGYSEICWGTALAPANYTNGQIICSIDGGSTVNRLQLQRVSSAGNNNAVMSTTSSVQYNNGASAGSWLQNTMGKIAIASTAGTQNGAFDGLAMPAGTGTPNPVSPTIFHIGVRGDSMSQFNGFVARIAEQPTSALSTTTLQANTQ